MLMAVVAVALVVRAGHVMQTSGTSLNAHGATAIRVLAVGSSVAEGWVDPHGGGYLKRAFAGLSSADHVPYELINKSAAGDTVGKISAQYLSWLRAEHPTIVVLSWGALDDLHNGTPRQAFYRDIQAEIRAALQAKAVVFVVTPPVTAASYKGYRLKEPALLHGETAAASALQSRNVYVFDVFTQMKQYLAHHGQTYVPYMADGWHPNARGHALAGNLLLQDIRHQFGTQDIRFHSS